VVQNSTRTKSNDRAASPRAAQYLRVSTDQQKYSVENQAAAIAAYAARRHISIVRTYSDQRSGVRIVGRDGLQLLIRDVQRGGADFDCILVYDVSRWGRFQDVDESAYYEFICKRAGKIIHYCADEFENDGSLASVILKNVKRVGAADYSRQLSKKVFLGQCRVATLGRWRGGPAGYGLRRRLIAENGKPKMLLKFGQRKNLKTEHCVLTLGPDSEIKIVQQIFDSFANRRKTRTEIANELNARGIRNSVGKLWSMQTIDNILKNEVYLGNIVYNRRSQKLGERAVENPSDMWIRCNNAFKPIVSPKLFAKAQKMLLELKSGRTRTDKELLDPLRMLLRKKGHLSIKLMQAAKLPHWQCYAKRFGSLNNAYKKIGFQPKSRYRFAEIFASMDGVVRDVAEKISKGIERRRSNVTFLSELYLLTINRGLTVGMAVARSVNNGSGDQPSRRWEIRKLKYRGSDLTLVIRMETSNTKIKDYYLIPTANLPPVREPRTRISDRHFGEFRHDDLDGVLKAIIDWSISARHFATFEAHAG
jgi:DNA invertase Pin-like site-specific DNA recombinase